MSLKNAVILLSMVALLSTLIIGVQMSARMVDSAVAADQAFPPFPTFPGNNPVPFPSLPVPFPTSAPTASPTAMPSVTPSPTPVPTSTNIYGTIKDSNGTAIPGVYALLLNRSGPASYSSTSDDNGYYMICHVPFGNYSIAYNRNNTTAFSTNLVLNHSTQKVNATLPTNALP